MSEQQQKKEEEENQEQQEEQEQNQQQQQEEEEWEDDDGEEEEDDEESDQQQQPQNIQEAMAQLMQQRVSPEYKQFMEMIKQEGPEFQKQIMEIQKQQFEEQNNEFKQQQEQLKKQQDEEEDSEDEQHSDIDEEECKDDTYGCIHYRRRCEIQSPCCKKWFGCRLCHDQEYMGPKGPCPEEVLDRYNISWIRCYVCKTEQKPSNRCENPDCKTRFARYYCGVCHLWNNKQGAKIYHCKKCKMCRVGEKKSLFHCDKCDVCIPRVTMSQHKCIQEMANQECPVCFDNLKISTKPWQSLSCGHSIHVECLQGLYKNGNASKCPLCQQSLNKMPKAEIQAIDAYIAKFKDKLSNFPPEFLDKEGKLLKVNIVCNDCNRKSKDVDQNPLGIKCGYEDCGSYHTDPI